MVVSLHSTRIAWGIRQNQRSIYRLGFATWCLDSSHTVRNLSVHAVTIFGPALGAAVAVHFFRLLNPHTMHSPLIVAGIFFGLAPVTLGAALSGQIENTQSWILPLLLWVILWSEERRERLPWVAVSWLLGALTSPYLAMGAALALPWLLWSHRSSWRATILAVISLSIAGWWLSPAEFDSTLHIFKPAYGRDELPNIWATPIPSPI